MSKTPRHPIPPSANNNPPTKSNSRLSSSSSKSNMPIAISNSMLFNNTNDPLSASSSRSSSLAGKKRPRESDGDSKHRLARRTKSTGDAREPNGRSSSSSAKDREAFQRGLIAVFVPKALQESKQGNLTHYNDLLAHFLPTPTMPVPALPPLLPLLRALSAHVSLLSPEIHSPLVTAVINLPWATGEEKFVKTFVGWAAVLVSAQPGWAKEVVGMAVKGLQWQPTFKKNTASPISRRIFHARHHLLLSHLISLIPTLPNVLQPLLIRNFPHKREPEVAQTTWIRNCCELIGYCPELGGRMWGEIVDRMLRIDVEITNSIEDDEDDDEFDDEDDDASTRAGPSQRSPSPTIDPLDLLISQEMPKPVAVLPEGSTEDDGDSDLDIDELSSVDGGSSDEDEEVTNGVKEAAAKEIKRANIKAMRGKLDGMLCHFFQHLEEYMGVQEFGLPAAGLAAQNMTSSYANSEASTPTSEYAPPISAAITSALNRRPSPTPAQSLSHFQTLLNLFSRQILPTSATQHIPFLLFLTSSFTPAHTDLFLGLLVSQALYATTTTAPSPASQPVSMNQRIAATVYIGSVVCRARFVTDDQARTVLTYLLAYIDGKLHQTRSNKRDHIDELPLFYAVCQAVMLIFCFRWRAFTSGADKEGDSFVGDMEMEGESGESDGDQGDGKWMSDLDVLQRALTSELNPLLGCNPTIVSTFAKVAHHTNFAYCFSIIEANQQSSHPRTASSHSLSTLAAGTSTQATSSQKIEVKSTTLANANVNAKTTSGGSAFSRTASNSSVHINGNGNGNAQATDSRSASSIAGSQTVPRLARQSNIEAGLDSYFPFDPYDLPRSKRYVERLYRTWAEVAIEAGNDSDSDSDSNSDSDVASESNSEDEEEANSASANSIFLGNTIRSRPLPLPASTKKMKIGSYGERQKSRLLSASGSARGDAGLSSSLEGMSISPSQFGLGGLGGATHPMARKR